ncbi:MAG: N-acetyltransferase [Clostridia bacterium]
MNYQIKEENQKFLLIEEEKEIGNLKFIKDVEGDFIIESIFIEEAYRGEGYAQIIFNEFIEKVKKEKRKVIPICTYAQAQFRKRKSIQYLLKNV